MEKDKLKGWDIFYKGVDGLEIPDDAYDGRENVQFLRNKKTGRVTTVAQMLFALSGFLLTGNQFLGYPGRENAEKLMRDFGASDEIIKKLLD
jgi:hypothetical protein